MGQLIGFGDTIQKDGIDKFDCAEGTKVKAMFINYQKPYACTMAFDETIKRYVECDKEMVIKYGLNPSPRYVFLVAKLTTDMNGKILGEQEEKVTYLSMSNKQYEHFVESSYNLGGWDGFVTLTKVKQKGNNTDYSYIDAMPASSNAQGFDQISQVLMARLNQLATDENLLIGSLRLVNQAMGLNKQQYEERIAKLKASNDKDGNTNQGGTTNQGNSLPQGNNAPQGNTMYVTAPQAPQAIPQNNTASVSNPNIVQPTSTVANNNIVSDIAPVEDLPF